MDAISWGDSRVKMGHLPTSTMTLASSNSYKGADISAVTNQRVPEEIKQPLAETEKDYIDKEETEADFRINHLLSVQWMAHVPQHRVQSFLHLRSCAFSCNEKNHRLEPAVCLACLQVRAHPSGTCFMCNLTAHKWREDMSASEIKVLSGISASRVMR